MATENRTNPEHKCEVCGGSLILTIGSDRAVCDHCGETRAVDPQDVKKYLDVYRAAETLMRTGTRAGYEDALTRLQAIQFIPQAREKALECGKKLETLGDRQAERSAPGGEEKEHMALGVLITVLTVLFLMAAVFLAVWAVYRLTKGQVSPWQIAALIAAAAVFAGLLFAGRSRE